MSVADKNARSWKRIPKVRRATEEIIRIDLTLINFNNKKDEIKLVLR